MAFVLQPWHVLITILSLWLHEHLQRRIDFLNNQVEELMKLNGKKRILLSDDARRSLAVKGRSLGLKALRELTTIVTPETIMRWHRDLVAKKWDYTQQRKAVGRPRVRQEIVDLVVRFAKENSTWGYDRIQGALSNIGHHIADSTVGNILKDHGIEPAPERQRTGQWRAFLKAHWNQLAAIDFTTVEAWTPKGLITYYLLFAIELKTHKVQFVGSTPNPSEPWMKQMALTLTNAEDGFLNGTEFLLMDRDTKFCNSFRDVRSNEGVKSVRLPVRSPNMNAFVERFMRSLKSECLNKMIFFGESSVRRAVKSYLEHYHTERNHQGLCNQLINPEDGVGTVAGKIECRERLGGMLKYYHRAA